MELTEDYKRMHSMIRGLGNNAHLLDEMPWVPTSEHNPWKECNKRILIVFQSRTGTTWLCELMKKTGVLGLPRESLHANQLISEFRENGFENFNEMMEENVKRHSTPNGVYAAKSGFFSLAPMFLVGEFPENIKEWKIIFVKRRDELEQAISIHKLNLNRQAASWVEPTREITDEDYSFEEISRELRNVRQANYAIETMLFSYGANYIELFYEDLCANPEKIIRNIAEYVEVGLGEVDTETRFKVQRNELTEIWKNRWREEVMRRNPLFQRIHFFE